MARQSLKRYRVVLLIILIGSLVSPQFVLAQQPVLSLTEALQNGQVTIVMRGIADHPIFIEPMLELTLTNQTPSQLSVMIPSGLTLRSEQEYADLVILKTEPASIDLGPNQISPAIQVIAYSLAYDKNFPNSQAEYQLEESINIRPEVRTLLDNIIAIGSENELDSQLAVWLVHNKLTLEQFDRMFDNDYSTHSNRVNQILSGSIDSWPSWGWALLFGGIILVLITGTGVIVWRIRRNNNHSRHDQEPNNKQKNDSWLDHVAEDDWQMLAEGGMAEVYIVMDRRHQPAQKVVVKLPKSAKDDSELQKNKEYRFETEWKLHKELKDRNIVQFIDAGECSHPESKQKTRYLAQEFVDGSTIEELIEKQPDRLDDPRIIEIMSQILDAVEYMHSQEIVHRDLTWKNIMIDKKGMVKIIDFGIATTFNSDQTKQLGFCPFGNPPFYAPSHIGSAVPARDFYSLAVLLFAMYGGNITHTRNDNDARDILLEEIKTFTNIPTRLLHVLSRGLQIKEVDKKGKKSTPKAKYKNVSEFRKDLELPRYQIAQLVEKAMQGTSPLSD